MGHDFAVPFGQIAPVFVVPDQHVVLQSGHPFAGSREHVAAKKLGLRTTHVDEFDEGVK